MTLGPLGPPPGPPTEAGACARCGRRIGSYLAYTEPGDTGGAAAARVCYRCHRLATRGHVPPSLAEVHAPSRHQASQFVFYRIAMFLVALCTFGVIQQTGEAAHFFYGLAGVVLLYSLSRRVHPGRRPKTGAAAPSAAEAEWLDACAEPPRGPAGPPAPPPDRAPSPGRRRGE